MESGCIRVNIMTWVIDAVYRVFVRSRRDKMRGVGSGRDLDTAANVAAAVPYEVRDLLTLSYDLSHALIFLEYLETEIVAAPQNFATAKHKRVLFAFCNVEFIVLQKAYTSVVCNF